MCAARDVRTVVLEIATGLARGKCPACKRRVWAASDGDGVRVGMIDGPAKVLTSEGTMTR